MFFGYSKSKRPEKSFLIFAGVLFLDQLLKNIFLKTGAFQKNYAALFGIEIDSFFSAIILFIFLSGTLFFLRKSKEARFFAWPIALIIAGIFSNTIDKLRMGFIIDYISLADLYIFNLADIAIASGTVFLIWRIIKE